MRGKHISVAQIKSAAIRHKILCIVMAIALLTLMIPGGLRAHAENEATETQAQEEQIVPAEEFAEGAPEAVVDDNEDIEITFVADPVGSATFKANGEVVDKVTVSKGAVSYNAAKTQTDQEKIYKDTTWEDLLYTVECVPNEGWSFKTWEDAAGYKVFDESGTLTAYLESSEPPTPETCTVNLSIEGEGTATFDNYDWETEELIASDITSLELEKGWTLWHDYDYIDYAYEMCYGYTDEYNFFIPVGYIVCNVESGEFQKWNEDYKVLDSDTFDLTATVDAETDSPSLTFYTEGNGHLEITYDQETYRTLDEGETLTVPDGAGYFNGEGKGDMYISTSAGDWICQVKAVADSGSEFESWDIVAGKDKHIITEDDTATATFSSESEGVFVDLDTIGTGSGKFYEYSENDRPISGLKLASGSKLYTTATGQEENNHFWVEQDGIVHEFYFEADEGSVFKGWDPKYTEKHPLILTEDMTLNARVVGPDSCLVKFEVAQTPTLPNARFFNNEGHEIKSDWGVEVPKHTGVIFTYSSTYPEISLWNVVDGEWIEIDTVTCVYNEDFYIFENWDPSQVFIEDQDEITVNAYLTGFVHLQGTAYDESHNPVEGAWVVFDADDAEGSNAELRYQDTTDENGNYQLNLPRGTSGWLYVYEDNHPLYEKYFPMGSLDESKIYDPILGEGYTFTVETFGNPGYVEFDLDGYGFYVEGNQVNLPKGAYFRASNGSSDGYAYIYVFITDAQGVEQYYTSFRVSTYLPLQLINWTCDCGVDIPIESDTTEYAVISTDNWYVWFNVEAIDDEAHDYFNCVWMVDGYVVDEWTDETYRDYFYDATSYSFDEDGVITLNYEDPFGGWYEQLIIEPVAAEGYYFDSYIDANTGLELTPDTEYIVDVEKGDINWQLNYETGDIPTPTPTPEEGGTAQTGDATNAAVVGLTIIALISCAYVVSRRVKINK